MHGSSIIGDLLPQRREVQLEVPETSHPIVSEVTELIEAEEETVYDFQEFVPDLAEPSENEFGSKAGSLSEPFLSSAWGEGTQHKLVQVNIAKPPSVQFQTDEKSLQTRQKNSRSSFSKNQDASPKGNSCGAHARLPDTPQQLRRKHPSLRKKNGRIDTSSARVSDDNSSFRRTAG